MSSIDFQVNHFRTYEVRVEGLSLGFINPGGGAYTPGLGEKLQYDGTTVILKDGREFTDVPQLRSAILNSNWLVPVGDKVTQVRPKSAGIQVRPTETRGNERVARTTVVTEQHDEREVVSIADRKKNREATNLEATRRVPLESQAARDAMAAQAMAASSLTGDQDLDELITEIDAEMRAFFEGLEEETGEEANDSYVDIEEQVESDILSMLNWAEEEDAKPKTKKRTKKTARNLPIDAPEDQQTTPIAKAKAAVPNQASLSGYAAVKTGSARNLPVDADHERKAMPVVEEDESENGGTVIGNVTEQKKTVIEREEEIAIDVAQAKPPQKSPAPPKRFGNTGAIVVDEQRDMGQISLSGGAAPIRLDESAKVASSSQESIKMGEAEVGRKAPAVSVDGGVAVGRVLSPTKRSFVASDANTSSSAIQRAEQGKQLRVEKFETDENVVGHVSEGAAAKTVATGDVQETTAGDSLEEVLPNAATGPKPEVHRRPEEDPAYQAVKMLIPDFKWDKDRPVKERVAEALKHIKNPQYIKGILAVETELAREEIKKALAKELEKIKKAAKSNTSSEDKKVPDLDDFAAIVQEESTK